MTMISRRILFGVDFSRLSVVVAGLPFFAMLFCVVWSILFNFEQSTATHCKVRNYLPSISAAIGGYFPQKSVWRICIALHTAPRFMIAFCYYGYYTQFPIKNHLNKFVAALCTLLHIAENFSLVVLTYISSTENRDVHEMMFVVFMVCSEVYMLLSCVIYRLSHTSNGRVMTKGEKMSLQYKISFLIFNMVMFLLAVYLFFRHNWYCEPGVYTGFAACEYLVVCSNIAFHYTAKLDFHHKTLVLYRNNQIIIEDKAT